MGAVSKVQGRGGLRRMLVAWVAAAGAVVLTAPSVLAGTESIRFDFDPDNPNAVHQWTAPEGVTSIEVEVAGGGGGAGNEEGGRGALVRADITVTGGETFDIGVGGGGSRSNNQGGGGGGASIIEGGDILIIAGGGGGGGSLSGRAAGNAGHNPTNGAGQSGSGIHGGDRGRNGIGGTGREAALSGANYQVGIGGGTGGQNGIGAQVGGAGGQVNNDGNGGGGAGFGGGAGGFFGSPGGAGGSTAQGTGVAMVEGATSYYSTNGGAPGVRAHSGRAATAGGHGWVILTWVAPPPKPEPDPTPATGDVPSTGAKPVALALAVPNEVRCVPLSPMTRGAWVRLPSASECVVTSPERSGASATLLGWSTSPDFSVDVAKNHVAHSSAALELHGANNQITAVFIPAGGWAHMTADATVFPIWGP